jgi:amino acid transporter
MTNPDRGPASDPRPDRDAPPPQATLTQILGAVFWSFFGVRRGDAMQRDTVTIKPHQVIVVGILFAALLVALLLILVHVITRSA